MTKRILRPAKAALALTALLFASCGLNLEKVNGNGNVVIKNRNVQEFKAISAGSGLEVIIEQGSKSSVAVEADENLHEHIMTEVENGELKIKSDVNIGQANAKKVVVTTTGVENIESSGGCSVKSRNVIKGDALTLTSSSGSQMEIEVDARSLTCESSSGASLKVSGKADRLGTDSSSGSTLNAEGVAANSVKAESSSGGSSYVNPIRSLEADASSGGSIFYTNTPEKLEKKTSSGGEVSQKK